MNTNLTELKIDAEAARKAYPTADAFGKLILEASFGEDFFKGNIIDRVNSMDDIFRIGGKTLEQLTAPDDTPDEVAYKVLKLGISVLNEGKIPDHSDSDQYKYEPRFIYKSGLGLSYRGSDDWHTNTAVGPRLCYLNYDALLKGVEVMKEYYHTFYNLKK